MQSKLTNQQLKDVKYLLSLNEYRQIDIARKLNIDSSTINYYYKLHKGKEKTIKDGYFNVELYIKETITI
jgi:predicted transcriptional regulator